MANSYSGGIFGGGLGQPTPAPASNPSFSSGTSQSTAPTGSSNLFAQPQRSCSAYSPAQPQFLANSPFGQASPGPQYQQPSTSLFGTSSHVVFNPPASTQQAQSYPGGSANFSIGAASNPTSSSNPFTGSATAPTAPTTSIKRPSDSDDPTTTTDSNKKPKTEPEIELTKIGEGGARVDAVYCDKDATVVFVSSDGVMFRVHDFHCKSNSSVLRNILSDSSTNDKIPCEEHSLILRSLLNIICTGEDTLDTSHLRQLSSHGFCTLLESLDKYDIHRGGIPLLRAWEEMLVDSGPGNSVRAFVVACNTRRESYAQSALRSFRSGGMMVNRDEIGQGGAGEGEGDGKVEGEGGSEGGSVQMDMRPWKDGGEYLATRIGTTAFVSYLKACMSASTYNNPQCQGQGQNISNAFQDNVWVNWYQAGNNFRLS